MFKVLQLAIENISSKEFSDPCMDFYIKLENARIVNLLNKLVEFPTETLKNKFNEVYPPILEISKNSKGIFLIF